MLFCHQFSFHYHHGTMIIKQWQLSRMHKKFGHNHSPTKKNLAKMPKSSPLKIKIWIKILFWQCYFGHTTILYLSILSIEHYQSIFLFFWFSCRKSQSKQKLAKRITHFMNINLPDIENNMFPQHDQKLFSFYDFSSIRVSVWCQKKHFHCTISWTLIISILKYFENKCMYISVYLCKKIFVPEMT